MLFLNPFALFQSGHPEYPYRITLLCPHPTSHPLIDAELAQPVAYAWAYNSVCFFSMDTQIHIGVENNLIRVYEINSGHFFGIVFRNGVGPFFEWGLIPL